jgi:hypothetical protein
MQIPFIVVAFVVAFVSLAACRSAPSQPRPIEPVVAAAPARPSTPEACRACNGDWGKHGLAQREGCLCRTKDAGKLCKSKADCESQCVAKDDPDTEIVDKGPPARGYFLGRCHAFTTFFGCARLLRGSPEPNTQLDELPMKICVD